LQHITHQIDSFNFIYNLDGIEEGSEIYEGCFSFRTHQHIYQSGCQCGVNISDAIRLTGVAGQVIDIPVPYGGTVDDGTCNVACCNSHIEPFLIEFHRLA
jgi:hypothetical protein